MEYILQTNHLTKVIDKREIVHDVGLHVQKGEIYGFLGPNGAGKTSVMKMLTNIWKPSGGSVEIFGETLTPSSYQVLKRMGSILEFPTFYDHMSGRENLKLHCEYMGYYHPGSVENALEMLHLSDAADKPVKSYSLGMKQRLAIAQVLMEDEPILIMDEPMNGLDREGIKDIRELILEEKRKGKIILLASHNSGDIEYLCDEVYELENGKVIGKK